MAEEQKVPKKRGRPPKNSTSPEPKTEPKLQKKMGPQSKNSTQFPPELAMTDRSVHGDKTVKRKKRSDELMNLGAEPGDNTHYLTYARVALDLPPIDPHDPVQLKMRINDYLDYCQEHDRRPNVIGLANWIGVDRRTIARWRRGEYTSEENATLIGKTVSIMEEVWAELMMNSKIHPGSGIFLSKNWFGYKDVQDVVVEPKNSLADVQDEEEIRKRIEADVVIDLDETDYTES